ncbi:MAG: saccharopine dehydrogenase NADP-binding domain-containing protein, partial [Candidatus Cloacimonetes bacterium]|nr:saccharopine dehydrogenase NADP-binding domain-containing protein [Candidatus Cloacimonadota bacterium]
MAEIAVLGCGLVGRAIALDLSRKHQVRAVDKNRDILDSLSAANIEPCLLDLDRENELQEAISGVNLVVNAVPGFMGFSTLRQVIEAGKDTVDIAFSPEDTGKLHELARSRMVTAVVDCGVAPGMSNVIIGYHTGKMKIQATECLVGGLPQVRSWPFQYKAPFSPIDVIEEYLRPARMRENGRIIIKPALSDPELVELPEIGTLEAFNTDGLRSLLETTDIPDLKEKTLRYPGHIEYIRVLRHIGLFSDREIM